MFDHVRGLRNLDEKFITRLNRVLELHQSSSLDEFRVCYRLTKSSASEIDKWICYAMDKKVKRFELDFLMDFELSPPGLFYTFPSCFPVETVTSVEYLSLSSCILQLPGLGNFRSLKHLFLKDVELDDEIFQNILSGCLLLERLSLSGSRKLVNVKVDGSSSKLRCLEIYFCHYLKTIEIYTSNLVTFRYIGPEVYFSLKNAPCLVEVSFCVSLKTCDNRLSYACAQFTSKLPQLERIVLELNPHEVCKEIKMLPTFSNLKVLTLWVRIKNESLMVFTSLLESSPSLRRFELHLLPLDPLAESKKIESSSGCLYQHLEEVEIGGFQGHEDEIQLLMYIVQNTITLKKIIIDPYDQYLDGNELVRSDFDLEILGIVSQSLQFAMEEALRFRDWVPPAIEVVIK
ncbi:hypothetical protein COLO4_23025 [Corchorus olitorius]|uniref:At1g61320/AtMIF1 LRR domain-containing protein n=1 Tax=Corchorus olitorius TaxID=93759 RepID=A0A1R3IIH6_9ROSI|nr:hypothetical protein COLO4_23025 [Corchorus olitorius]